MNTMGEETDISGFSLKERNWIIAEIYYVPHNYDKSSKVVTVYSRYPADSQALTRAMQNVKWEMEFVPVKYRSLLTLPHDSNAHKNDETKQQQAKAFREVAVRVYWSRVEKIMKTKRADLLEARKILHATGTLPPRNADREAAGYKYKIGDNFWHTEDYIVAFMLQFEDWQQETYDMHKIDQQGRLRFLNHLWEAGKNKKMTVAGYCSLMIDDIRNDLPQYLIYCGRLKDAKTLIDDPLWGDDAQFEVENDKRSQDHSIDEMLRIAQSHEHIQQIDAIIRKGSPTLYSVHYPWGPYGGFAHTLENPPKDADGKVIPPFHTFPNCLAVMGDGGPIFKLEVLDTDGLNKYALRILKAPWWGKHRQLGEEMAAGEGEYDFDFPYFNISEGDEFDHATLLKVLDHGIKRILTRSERKTH
jgi:hypothetical protein